MPKRKIRKTTKPKDFHYLPPFRVEGGYTLDWGGYVVSMFGPNEYIKGEPANEVIAEALNKYFSVGNNESQVNDG